VSRAETPSGRGQRARSYIPLFHRVAAINAALLLAAVAVTILILVPGNESSINLDEEGLVLVIAIVLVVLLNVLLLRRVVRPLQQLTAVARTVDLAQPGPQMPDAAPTSEAGELALTFNEMLARLQAERRDATGRVLAAQEEERLRIARELHDHVGQELTAVLLLLSRVQSRASADVRPAVLDAQEAVRSSLEDVRRIVIELRPEALDDLGLESALAVLCDRFAERAGLDVSYRHQERLPELSHDAELVIYRVAQEALTNIARHSGGSSADLTLEADGHMVVLTVSDHGTGLDLDPATGSGIRGMRERAGLIGATLDVRNRTPGPGSEVRLQAPTRPAT
jgi:two-component system, NarL family, sensor histidine kinase UhpB